VLYEIFSYGDKPYRDWSNSRVWMEVRGGFRLPPPPGTPGFVAEVMSKSWHAVRCAFTACLTKECMRIYVQYCCLWRWHVPACCGWLFRPELA
jgi:hypothetical protein